MKIISPKKDTYQNGVRTGGLPPARINRRHFISMALAFLCFLTILSGCAGIYKKVAADKMTGIFEKKSILATRTGSHISYPELIAELEQVHIIYVGEKHTDPVHHTIQLTIIKDIASRHPQTVVGMEMFDRSYQPILDLWTAGTWDYHTFLKRTHWYANWKMDDQLYADILSFLKEKHIRLIGLNIPFHIPSKIAFGGIDSLSKSEKAMLPDDIDTSNTSHRQYIKEIFDQHAVKGIDDFETFYAAQCVWEDTMADTIARNLGDNKMVVITGNGHIVKKFGIPDRAFKRTGASFKTVYLVPEGTEVDPSFADYIWITPEKEDNTQK